MHRRYRRGLIDGFTARQNACTAQGSKCKSSDRREALFHDHRPRFKDEAQSIDSLAERTGGYDLKRSGYNLFSKPSFLPEWRGPSLPVAPEKV
jgi:hypothetical protein